MEGIYIIKNFGLVFNILIMPNPFFRFKQFTVYHDKCAMKVGTDGVLLGAWADVENVRNILDVGCGTALITLMMAQRNSLANIKGVDIDSMAVEQAKENVERSLWKDRIVIEKCDFNSFQSDVRYDLIVSNPPFFKNALKGPCQSRNTARHNDSLFYDNLISKSVALLSEQGILSLIIPIDYRAEVILLAKEFGLFESRETRVITSFGMSPKRILLEFSKKESRFSQNELVIELSRHNYSDDYIKLTRDFYLKM